ncbi:MAG: SDR family oxidoreductase [Gordonia sp. (in: high G+C Gram-positive bacteria)]|uniref:SDR family NAD(P)-dependent oxidoreductase n=1 Tax=Gordonia sp. (in: high G+C Gram-positive bacteria) TaxID=84139 RepID=UPI0039E51B68
MNTAAAVVTGGARGIGAAIVRSLVGAGVPTVIADLLDDDGERLADALGDLAVYRHLDVTDEAGWQSVLADAEDAFGRVGYLVNNAGILAFGPVDAVETEEFRRVMDVNLFGTWLGIKTAVPYLREVPGAAIVNISSTAGLTGTAGVCAYSTSKWAVRGLTKSAAVDLGPSDIRVMSVHPGPIKTPMVAGIDESLSAGYPIARFGEPEEVAATVRHALLEATYSTGVEFIVDGGATTGIVAPPPMK